MNSRLALERKGGHGDGLGALPRPSPDQELYQVNLETGFRLFPEREENYRRYRASARAELLNYLPIRLDIENVSCCNYHCTMCQVSDWPGFKRASDMSLEDYKSLVDTQYGLVEIKLQGMGEPLLGKCYQEMIQYARARHIWVRTTTNGSLLHVKENYKRLIDADICELQVSVDGATDEAYEKIRRGGRFKTVLQNCTLLNQYCRDVNRKRTRMWVVVQKDNFHELKLFPGLASSLGFERLTFSLDLNDWGQEKWRTVNDRVDMHLGFAPSLGKSLVALGKEHGIEVTFWLIDNKYDATDKTRICPWPFERSYISSDMLIVPCCMIANPKVMALGEARKLAEGWNGEQMVHFRRLHLSGRIPRYCRSCYVRESRGGSNPR